MSTVISSDDERPSANSDNSNFSNISPGRAQEIIELMREMDRVERDEERRKTL